MRDGNENAGDDRDGGVKEKASGKSITKKQKRADRRNNGLNIQDHVHHRWIPVFQRQREEDGAHRRPSESGEKHVAPRARVDFWNFFQARDQNRQEHDEDENVFPKDDHLGVEQFIERDAPRALGAPERCAKTDEPRAVTCAVRFALLHRTRCSVGAWLRQRGGGSIARGAHGVTRHTKSLDHLYEEKDGGNPKEGLTPQLMVW